jgi:hypothetical protein
VIPRHVNDKPFTISFPDRSEWKDGFQPDRIGGLIWYTDCSKTNKGTGAGVCCYGTGQTLSFSLGQKCMPQRHAQLRIGIIKTGTSTFCQTVKQQLKHSTNTRSPQNWSGTATNPSRNWPDITGFN